MLNLEVKFTGRTPLVLHNVRLANPLDPYTKAMKAITGKRKKTEDDFAELIRIEWEGGLYFDEKLGPYVPARYPIATIHQAAAIERMKTPLARGMTVSAPDGSNRLALEYDGPRTIEALWADAETHCDVRAVRVGQARTFRARPAFPEWAITFHAALDGELVDLDVFHRICERSGRLIGMGEAVEGTGSRARYTSEVKVLSEDLMAAAA